MCKYNGVWRLVKVGSYSREFSGCNRYPRKAFSEESGALCSQSSVSSVESSWPLGGKAYINERGQGGAVGWQNPDDGLNDRLRRARLRGLVPTYQYFHQFSLRFLGSNVFRGIFQILVNGIKQHHPFLGTKCQKMIEKKHYKVRTSASYIFRLQGSLCCFFPLPVLHHILVFTCAWLVMQMTFLRGGCDLNK